MKKSYVIGLAVAACLIVIGVTFSLSGQSLSSSLSLGQRYRVEVTQRRGAAGIERRVYLNAYRGGEQFVRNKLIYTGDLLDNDFKDLYPNYSWAFESVLKLGRDLAETQSNSLRIKNESSQKLTFAREYGGPWRARTSDPLIKSP